MSWLIKSRHDGTHALMSAASSGVGCVVGLRNCGECYAKKRKKVLKGAGMIDLLIGTLASIVLPVPGGPYSRTPLVWRSKEVLYNVGCSSGRMTFRCCVHHEGVAQGEGGEGGAVSC